MSRDPFDELIDELQAYNNGVKREGNGTVAYTYSVVKSACKYCGEPAMFQGSNYCRGCYGAACNDGETVSRVVVQGIVDDMVPRVHRVYGPEVRMRGTCWQVKEETWE